MAVDRNRCSDRRAVLAGSLASVVSAIADPARAAPAYPTRPVKIVVPYPAGNTSDTYARRFGDRFQSRLGQPFIIENRGGAGGNIGSASVARSEPDGYTVLWGSNATHAGNEFLYASLGYDPTNDFEPVAGIMSFGMALAVAKDSRYTTVAEILAASRAQPAGLAIGMPSNTSRVVLQMLREQAGVEMTPVPYAGSAQALIGLLRGDVQMVIDTVTALMGPIDGGQAKALATTSPKRSASLSGVPTFRESGADVALEAWLALYAPRGTPQAIVAALNREVADALADPAMRTALLRDGATALGGSPGDLVALMRRDRAIWGPIVRTLGLKAQ